MQINNHIYILFNWKYRLDTLTEQSIVYKGFSVYLYRKKYSEKNLYIESFFKFSCKFISITRSFNIFLYSPQVLIGSEKEREYIVENSFGLVFWLVVVIFVFLFGQFGKTPLIFCLLD